MKPTDIWTNHPNPQFRAMCKKGDPCHGGVKLDKTKGSGMYSRPIMRGIMPDDFINHIVNITEVKS